MQFKNLKCSMEEEKKRSKRSKTIFFLFSPYLKKKNKADNSAYSSLFILCTILYVSLIMVHHHFIHF